MADPKHDAHHEETINAEVLASEARLAANAEHNMTLWQAVAMYPKAIGWSLLVSSTLIMEGYDLALLGNLYASPAFNKKFGEYNPSNDEYQVSAAWQSGLSNGARAGEIIGLIIAGWVSDRYGYKMTTIGSLVLMIASVFALFFAPNVKILVLGEVLCGSSFISPTRNDFGADHDRHSMGCFPERQSCLRFRSCPRCVEAVSHHLYQYVLGHWSIFRCRRQ
jgi:hypothetical protein